MQQYSPLHDYYAGLAGYLHASSLERLNNSRDLGSITDRSKDMDLNSHHHSKSGRHHGIPTTSSYTDDVDQDRFAKASGYDGVQATSRCVDNTSTGYTSTQSRYHGKRGATNHHSTHGENHDKPDKTDYTDNKPVPHPKPVTDRRLGRTSLESNYSNKRYNPSTSTAAPPTLAVKRKSIPTERTFSRTATNTPL